MLGVRRSTPNNQHYAYVVGRLVVFKYHYASDPGSQSTDVWSRTPGVSENVLGVQLRAQKRVPHLRAAQYLN